MTDYRHEIDFKSMMERLGGLWDLAEELASMTMTDAPIVLGQLKTSLTLEDLESAHRHAHSLKGLVATVGCTRCEATASRIEKLIAAGDFETSRSLLPELTIQLDQSLLGLKQIIDDGQYSLQP